MWKDGPLPLLTVVATGASIALAIISRRFPSFETYLGRAIAWAVVTLAVLLVITAIVWSAFA